MRQNKFAHHTAQNHEEKLFLIDAVEFPSRVLRHGHFSALISKIGQLRNEFLTAAGFFIVQNRRVRRTL